MAEVPFLDLVSPHRELKAELDAAYERIVASGWFILGPEVQAFEEEFASFCGAKHCVGVGNGLDALFIALRALGVGPGDEVIVPSNTYIATWLAVSYTGATPVPVEPDERTFNLDPERVLAAITPKTRVILPVHLYGLAADVDAIRRAIGTRDIKILEDAAQAHGASLRGRGAGALGDVAAFSFYPGKNLGALGDGGAVVTDNGELADRVRIIRNYGSRVKYHNEVIGVNSRLDPLQAAFLRVKLPRLLEWNGRRERVAELYDEGLRGVGDLILPGVPEGHRSAWHLYVVRTSRRAELQAALTGAGIGTMIHYPIPPHLQPAYAPMGIKRGSLPLSEALHDTVLSLPIGPHLAIEDAVRVVTAVRKFFG